jgi:molybdopterin-containing oxidoreductase family iron-sulfur binding subunit
MPSLTDTTGARYWRSLDELARTPEFREAVRREFPDDEWDRLPPATRRQFLRVMGASLGLAGLTACRWPKEEIVPFAHRPEERIPGVPQQFATSLELAGAALGVLVTSYDGRPIKVEGNPEHPDSLGAATAVAQAAILGLYDPDRSRRIVLREAGQEYVKDWDEFASDAARRFVESAEGVAVLSEASSSPSLLAVKQRFLETVPGARWYEYEPISRDNEREGLRLAHGRPLRLIPHVDRTRVVACFDADPLFEHPSAVRLARQFAALREPRDGAMSRLYVAESSYTLTGGRADGRIAVQASEVAAVLAAVAARIAADYGIGLPDALVDLPGAGGVDGDFVAAVAADLVAHRGAGLVMVGPRQAPEVHALAAALNHALGNVGIGLTCAEDPDPDRPPHAAAIVELTSAMRDGSVNTLVILGGNPVYDAPADLEFAEYLSGVPYTVHLSLHDDETSRRCRWHLPRAHQLEEWGDGRAWDGTWTCRQPLIEPLYGGRSAVEVVTTLLEPEPVRGHDVVREVARAAAPGVDFERFWRQALHDGIVPGTAWPEQRPELYGPGLARAREGLAEIVRQERASANALELVLVADAKVYDGRFANNGWLQELPDAITKVTWDNALTIAPTTARELGIADGDVVELSAVDVSLELPVYVLPGTAPFSCAVSVGYGRAAAGSVGTGVGVDTFPLRRSTGTDIIRGVNLRPTGRRYRLATTQDHHAIDTLGFAERNFRIGNLVREATLDAYLADPELFHHMDHHPPLEQLWKAHTYEGEQWGMAIDLNACTGCNACVVACQAENNIPLVGRQQVINQREMHWLRIDRYFKTPPGVAPDQVDGAEMVFQPMTCVHCENAPCEQVCPVAATQHTPDGLNAMAYNRCIGTRYCSNNCPFKVRRFNFFNYHKTLADVSKMQFNPEVTVRSRGVMEKCTFCVQRIQSVRIQARNDRRPIRDGEVVPACAQTCPSRAIAFGNLNDPESEVSKLRGSHRAYATLVELNIRPRTHYLARLSNPAGRSGQDDRQSEHGSHGKESA